MLEILGTGFWGEYFSARLMYNFIEGIIGLIILGIILHYAWVMSEEEFLKDFSRIWR